MNSQSFASDLRTIILNSKKPLVLRNFKLHWKCFPASMEEWLQNFDTVSESKKLPFEQMSRQNGDSPQWERDRKTLNITCSEFLNEHSCPSQSDWCAYNYHRIDEIPEMCKKDINFSCFGFPLAEKDCTFWLGSSGANTPCHYDTYGCNIVIQIYGRKSWLLFPPETPLTAIRIPYEESSVYCSENFYSPKSGTEFPSDRISAYHCILEASDVLIVPKKWWHYVESLDRSLSVNAWIPLDDDKEAQIEECIVKFIIERFSKSDQPECRNFLLNPNQIDLIAEEEELFNILKYLISSDEKESSENSYPYQYLTEAELSAVMSTVPERYLTEVHLLSPADFCKIMEQNAERYEPSLSKYHTSKTSLKEILLNSFCAPNVIKSVGNEIKTRYSNMTKLKVEAH